MKIKLNILCFLVCIAFATMQAQNEGGALIASFNFGAQSPDGDLANRFGNNLYSGLNLEYITDKGNIIFGVNYSFMFGNTVKEDVVASLRDNNGLIFGGDFAAAMIELRQRGSYMSAHIGKLFPLSKENRRSGIRFHLGAGLLQHRVRVQDDPQVFVDQLAGDNKKGFDRLSNGFALSQFLGYQHLAKNRLANFFIGVEVIEGFTQNRRTVNVDTGLQDTDSRLDVLLGAKIGWILPFYIGQPAETIFY